MIKLEYRQLGQTGYRVSRLGFGGAVLGIQNYLRPWNGDSADDVRHSRNLMAAAVDHGITLFDTAADYGEGRSEALIGDFLGNRDDIVVTSKYPIWKYPQMNLAETVDASLRRLRRDRIDVLQIHGLSFGDAERHHVLRDGGVLDEMEMLKDSGKIGAIGFTAEDGNPICYEFIRSGRFDTTQLCFNLVQTEAYNARRECGPMLEAKKLGLGVLSMRTMTSGTIQRFLQVARVKVPSDLGQSLLRFVLANPCVDCALVGFTTIDEIRQCVEVFQMPAMDVETLFDPMV